jgi:hypothetical protein
VMDQLSTLLISIWTYGYLKRKMGPQLSRELQKICGCAVALKTLGQVHRHLLAQPR